MKQFSWITLIVLVLAGHKDMAGQSAPAGQLTNRGGVINKPQPTLPPQGSQIGIEAKLPGSLASPSGTTGSNPGQPATNATTTASTPPACAKHAATANSDGSYPYRWYLPLWGTGCTDAAVLNFFSVTNSIRAGNQVQYLYNPTQSTNQINADLFTATFRPGLQVVLAGTATSGSSTASTAGQTQSAPATDSPSTAVAKLEQGGDFNLRIPLPLASRKTDTYAFDVKFLPNLGFTVSGLTAQNTITGSTDYSANFPLEGYFQTTSIATAGQTQSLIYFDFKGGAEVISSDLATKIGLTSNRYFFLGQAAAGIEFAGSVRVGFQYIIGPSQIYAVPTTSGSTPTGGSVSGLHLVVSFSPSSNKSNTTTTN